MSTRKKKIVWHSNPSRAFTGFGRATKSVLKRLYATDKYEIVEFGAGLVWGCGQPNPWKTQGTIPANKNVQEELKKDPNQWRMASYGYHNVDNIIKEEKPDVYIGVEDIWGINYVKDRRWWNKLGAQAIWTTLDSLPLSEQATNDAHKFKDYFVWAKFAEDEMKRLQAEDEEICKATGKAPKYRTNHVKTLHGPVEDASFKRLSPEIRAALRQENNIPQDALIIGFVFRNQLRKSVESLLQGFKDFLKDNPKSYLLLHTCWHEEIGWNIPKFIEELKIPNDRVLTTYICRSCKKYEVKPFIGEKIKCKYCGNAEGQFTVDVNYGISEEQLNEVYNLMDVYCHPFTSGGQEMPIQEAKLAELITLVTNYSCGEEYCTDESGGLPLDWAEYREIGSGFIKAATYASSITKQLNKVFKMDKRKKREWEQRARKFALEECGAEVIAKFWEDYIDNASFTEWDFDFKDTEKNPNYPVDMSIKDNLVWLKDIYIGILGMPVEDTDAGLQHWLRMIDSGHSRDAVVEYFKQTANKANNQPKQIEFKDILDKDDEGKRIAFVIPQSIGDIIMCTSLFENIKKMYPDHNLYVITQEKYFCIMDGNPYVHKCVKYEQGIDSLVFLEGAAKHKGFFEVAYFPAIGTQKILAYTHNGKDKIQLDLKDF